MPMDIAGIGFHQSMALRLQNYRDAVLRFLIDPVVPFTNNLAEQDIRMMKCKQKISGGFRTLGGAEQFARIRGFLSTARKQGWNMMLALRKAMMGDELAMGKSPFEPLSLAEAARPLPRGER